MKTYHQLATENRYLYGKAENCTMLMGLAMLKKQDRLYDDYKILRGDLLKQIEVNLELIEDIWESQIVPEEDEPLAIFNVRSAKRLSEADLSKLRIMELYKENVSYSVAYIAAQSKCSLDDVRDVIKMYHNYRRTNEITAA